MSRTELVSLIRGFDAERAPPGRSGAARDGRGRVRARAGAGDSGPAARVARAGV